MTQLLCNEPGTVWQRNRRHGTTNRWHQKTGRNFHPYLVNVPKNEFFDKKSLTTLALCVKIVNCIIIACNMEFCLYSDRIVTSRASALVQFDEGACRLSAAPFPLPVPPFAGRRAVRRTMRSPCGVPRYLKYPPALLAAVRHRDRDRLPPPLQKPLPAYAPVFGEPVALSRPLPRFPYAAVSPIPTVTLYYERMECLFSNDQSERSEAR